MRSLRLNVQAEVSLGYVRGLQRRAGVGDSLAALSTSNNTPVVLKVAEVHHWVAMEPGRNIDRTESELRLPKAILAAGMKEPPRDRNGKVTRVKVDGLYHNLIACTALLK